MPDDHSIRQPRQQQREEKSCPSTYDDADVPPLTTTRGAAAFVVEFPHWRWLFYDILKPSLIRFDDPQEEQAFVEYIFPVSQTFQLFVAASLAFMAALSMFVVDKDLQPGYDSGAQVVSGTIVGIILIVTILVSKHLQRGWYGANFSEWSWIVIAMFWCTSLQCSWTQSIMSKCATAFPKNFVAMVVANPESDQYNVSMPVPWIVAVFPTYRYDISAMHRCADHFILNYTWTTLIIFLAGMGRVKRILYFFLFDVVMHFAPRWIFLAIGNADSPVSPVRFYRSDLLKIYYYAAYFIIFAVRERRLRAQFRSQRALLEDIKRSAAAKHAVESIVAAILPAAVLDRMVRGELVVDVCETVTVLFSDIAGFTAWSERRSAADVGLMLNRLYRRIDQDLEVFGVEKISTIGDAYWAACGLPTPAKPLTEGGPATTGDGSVRMVAFGLHLQHIVAVLRLLHDQFSDVRIRVGISTGAATGGIVGTRQLAYQIFGAVNEEAEDLERQAPVGTVVLCERTKMLAEGRLAALCLERSVAMFDRWMEGPSDRSFLVEGPLPWAPPGLHQPAKPQSPSPDVPLIQPGGSAAPQQSLITMLTPSPIEQLARFDDPHPTTDYHTNDESEEDLISRASTRSMLLSTSHRPGSIITPSQQHWLLLLTPRQQQQQGLTQQLHVTPPLTTALPLGAAELIFADTADVRPIDAATSATETSIDLEVLRKKLSLRKRWWSTTFADGQQEEDYAAYSHALFQSWSSVGVVSFIQAMWLFVALMVLASESTRHAYPAPVYIIYIVLFVLASLNCAFAPSVPALLSWLRILLDFLVQLIALWFWIRAPYLLPFMRNAGVQPRFSLLSGDVSFITFTTATIIAGLGTPRYFPWYINTIAVLVLCVGPTAIFWIVSEQFFTISFINMVVVVPVATLPGALRLEVSQRAQYVVDRVAVVAHAEIRANVQQLEALLSRTVPAFAIPELIAWLSTADEALRLSTVISHSVPCASVLFVRVPAISREISETGVDPTAAFQKASLLAELYDDVIAGTFERTDVKSTDTLLRVMAAIHKATTVIKVKTIGDIALIAAGLHRPGESRVPALGSSDWVSRKVTEHGDDGFDAQALAYVAVALQRAIQSRLTHGGEPVQVVGGMHSGPVISGVLGDDRLMYDVFGDTVNTASRIMTSSQAGIWVSEGTAALLARPCRNPLRLLVRPSDREDWHDAAALTFTVDQADAASVLPMKDKGLFNVRQLRWVGHDWVLPEALDTPLEVEDVDVRSK